ncbi:hypothetical protein GOB93_01060 [Acetobacter musti]|uniref:Uncharacterized protein n=1 Tax=Acetobacter musti TaxID=864732 RepID=A0ABX0JI97_9PROT|nr:hypothetical protein [Acetobacter musti]NHN83231.1 hypothetical protein [Acetobacter musti]
MWPGVLLFLKKKKQKDFCLLRCPLCLESLFQQCVSVSGLRPHSPEQRNSQITSQQGFDKNKSFWVPPFFKKAASSEAF